MHTFSIFISSRLIFCAFQTGHSFQEDSPQHLSFRLHCTWSCAGHHGRSQLDTSFCLHGSPRVPPGLLDRVNSAGIRWWFLLPSVICTRSVQYNLIFVSTASHLSDESYIQCILLRIILRLSFQKHHLESPLLACFENWCLINGMRALGYCQIIDSNYQRLTTGHTIKIYTKLTQLSEIALQL